MRFVPPEIRPARRELEAAISDAICLGPRDEHDVSRYWELDNADRLALACLIVHGLCRPGDHRP